MELGTSKAPARPFMGPAAIASHDKIEKIISAEMKHAVHGHGHGELWEALSEVHDLGKEAVEAGDEYLNGDRKE